MVECFLILLCVDFYYYFICHNRLSNMNFLKKQLLKIFIKFLRHETIQRELDRIHLSRKLVIDQVSNKSTPYKEILSSPPVPIMEKSCIFQYFTYYPAQLSARRRRFYIFTMDKTEIGYTINYFKQAPD